MKKTNLNRKGRLSPELAGAAAQKAMQWSLPAQCSIMLHHQPLDRGAVIVTDVATKTDMKTEIANLETRLTWKMVGLFSLFTIVVKWL